MRTFLAVIGSIVLLSVSYAGVAEADTGEEPGTHSEQARSEDHQRNNETPKRSGKPEVTQKKHVERSLAHAGELIERRDRKSAESAVSILMSLGTLERIHLESQRLFNLARAYAVLGKYRAAIRTLSVFENMGSKNSSLKFAAMYNKACYHALYGNVLKAFGLLLELDDKLTCSSQKEVWESIRKQIRIDPDLKSIREHPKYGGMLALAFNLYSCTPARRAGRTKGKK